MGSKGSQQTQTNQTQTYQPDPYARQAMEAALGQAQGVAQTPFQTPVAPVAGFSPDQGLAMDITRQAQGTAQPYINQAQQYFSPQGTQAFLNPYTQNVTQNLQDIFGKQMSQATGQLTQQAGGVGADRIAVGQSELAKQQGLAAGQTYAGLYGNAAQLAQGAGFGTANLGTAAQNAAFQGANQLLGTGGLQQQLAQAQMNAPYQNILQQIAWPYQNSQFFSGAVGALAPGLGGTTAGTGANTYPGASPWGTIAGLGMAGAGVYGYGNKQGWWGGGGGNTGTDVASATPAEGVGQYSARGGRINPYAPGGVADDGTGGDSTPTMPAMPAAATATDPVRYAEMQQLQAAANPNQQFGGRPIQLPSGVSGQPINIAPQNIVPQAQLTPIKPNIPQLNLNPQQSGGSGSGGVDWASLIKTGATIAAMFKQGGAVDNPHEHLDHIKAGMHRVFGRGGRNPYAYDDGGNVDPTAEASPEPQLGLREALEARAAKMRENMYGPIDLNTSAGPSAFAPPETSTVENAPAVRAATRVATPAAAAPAPQPDTAAADNPYQAPPLASTPPHAPREKGFIDSPWAALITAGLGTMAASGQRDARGLPISPFAAIGMGGMQGMQQLQTQRAAEQKDTTIEQEARKLDQSAEAERNKWTQMTPYQKGELGTKRRELGYKQELLQAGLISQDALDDMALSYRRGNTAVIAGLGRGTQGPVNISRFWNTLEQQLKAEGATGADIAAAKANYSSQTAAMKSQAVRSANIESAVEEVDNMLPILDRTAKALDQGKFVPWNKLVQLVQGNISDPKLAEFTGSLRALQSAYAVALNRGANVPTVHAMQASEEMLSKVTSYESLKATIGIMKQEMEAARSAPEKVAQRIEERIRKGGAAAPAPAATPAAPAAAAPSVPTPGAISALRQDRTKAAEFDAKYGAGAAARVLGAP